MSLITIARKLQRADQLLPKRWRLPLRYRAQSALNALEPEFELLPELLRGRQGRVALDIGANLGIYTYALSRLGMQVHAFEPQPSCCDVIRAWASGKLGITVHNKGVGSTGGELVLHIPVVDGIPVQTRASFQPFDSDQVEMRVPVVNLDSMSFGNVAFIKIDVEGFELQVLLGATRLLGEMKPILLVEIDRTKHDVESFGQVIQLLSEHGYRSHVYAQGKLTDCSDDPWNAPEHHYNFIFIAYSGDDT